MNTKKFNDEDIQSLLKKYQPLPPPAPKSLLNTILYRIGFEKQAPNYRSMWIGLASGLASCVLVFALIDRQFEAKFRSESALAPQVAITTMLEEDDEAISSLDAPSLNVGEDYLNLVSR